MSSQILGNNDCGEYIQTLNERITLFHNKDIQPIDIQREHTQLGEDKEDDELEILDLYVEVKDEQKVYNKTSALSKITSNELNYSLKAKTKALESRIKPEKCADFKGQHSEDSCAT